MLAYMHLVYTHMLSLVLRDPLLNLSSLIIPSQPLIWKAGHHNKSSALSDETHITITVKTQEKTKQGKKGKGREEKRENKGVRSE